MVKRATTRRRFLQSAGAGADFLAAAMFQLRKSRDRDTDLAKRVRGLG